MRSATTSYCSDEQGVIRPKIIEIYEKLSKGGIGLIVKGHLYVSDDGKPHSGMAGISNDKHILGLKELTESVHRYDGKIIAQLNHAGFDSLIDRAGPSEYHGIEWKARALTRKEIRKIVNDFGDAAERVVASGFDGVQLHAAHGYLISQFLSKLSNKRTDCWGGNIGKRMKLLHEIISEIRFRVANFPLMVKLNSDDFSSSGFTLDEAITVAKTLGERDIDLIEVSGGGIGRQNELFARARSSDPNLKEAYFAGHAKKIREATKPMPLALVGGIRSKCMMEAILRKDVADLISMSRPFIREPDLVNRLGTIQDKSKCISCNACNPLHGRGRVDAKFMLGCYMK
jgi:2,4-dienoyl-CoA reductase-like NADH-dependent reductase (Old Yellow Enzyme family)